MLHKSMKQRKETTANQNDVPTLYYPSIIAWMRSMGERLKLCAQVNERSPAGAKERYCSSSVAYVLLHMIIDDERRREERREEEKRKRRKKNEEEDEERNIAVHTHTYTQAYPLINIDQLVIVHQSNVS